MTELSVRLRALLDFLGAYHGQGFTPAERNALPEAVLPDLDALIELGMVEVRFIPLRAAAAAEVAIIVDGAEKTTVVEPAPAPAAAKAPARKGPAPWPSPPAETAKALASRATAWDDERKARFLEALAATGVVSKAGRAIGVGPNSAYYPRHRDPAFRAAWDGVMAARRAQPAAEPVTPPKSAAPAASPAPPPRVNQGEIAARATPAPPQRRRPTDAEISADALKQEEERRRIAALRPPMSVDEAQLILQRKGRIVHRASVTGGPADRWKVSGFAELLDDAMLKNEAERVEARAAK